MAVNGCGCMTEPNTLDPTGLEVVLTHSSLCPLHPDYEAPRGDCSVCRISRRLTKKGLVVRHNGIARSRNVCAGSGKAPRPLDRSAS